MVLGSRHDQSQALRSHPSRNGQGLDIVGSRFKLSSSSVSERVRTWDVESGGPPPTSQTARACDDDGEILHHKWLIFSSEGLTNCFRFYFEGELKMPAITTI